VDGWVVGFCVLLDGVAALGLYGDLALLGDFNRLSTWATA